ncbi:response regulator transcription factor [Kineothrix sp. MB12-C1]|uniref:response regulator transcription factor n=1 Tax=Kineothrix sp. MB12-C1 TaxID=3070215 RepID=UPI0027D226D9|nr:response regulator [Kineothrix sp. MB12-C1]WMC93998.1 response regulator [Kineothrix sp. MB12-C1]
MKNKELKKFRILIVEDEVIVRNSIVNILTEHQYDLDSITCADNGFQALESIDERPPHIVITDIRMPLMDGLTLSREIHYRYPAIKVIILTGYNEFEYAREALKTGVTDYLLKPIDEKELIQSMNQVLIYLNNHYHKLYAQTSLAGHSYTPQELAKISLDYLKQHYTTNQYLTNLSKELGYTSDYLSKIFKKTHGISPSKYVTDLRIYHAKMLLEEDSKLSMKEISELLGYTDQFYFSRVFKSVTGVYPSNYQKQVRT